MLQVKPLTIKQPVLAVHANLRVHRNVLTFSSTPVFSLQGAGQDVGRSCILVSVGGKNIMLDCGMHMGYNDDVSEQLSLQAKNRVSP